MASAQVTNPATIIPGQRFGRLTTVAYVKAKRGWQWKCKCDCGKASLARSHRLIVGHTKSCGCLKREMGRANGLANRTHGKSKSTEYQSYRSMIARCENPNAPAYPHYGAAGIMVCARWRRSFAAFLRDMGPRLSMRHTLDRFPDGKGNYEPGNVRWANDRDQQNNRKTTRKIKFNGETLSITEWSRRFGVNRQLIRARIDKGWTIKAAITTPPLPRGSLRRRVPANLKTS